MSQQTVFSFLRKHKEKWFTVKQVAKALDASVGSITCNFKKLREHDAVDWKIVRDDNHWRRYIYKYKKE